MIDLKYKSSDTSADSVEPHYVSGFLEIVHCTVGAACCTLIGWKDTGAGGHDTAGFTATWSCTSQWALSLYLLFNSVFAFR